VRRRRGQRDAGRAAPHAGRGVFSVYRAERRKLLAQVSTRVLALVCLLGPFAFAAILNQQSGVPADTLLGVWVHTSGYAVPFVILGFAGSWGFPVLAGVLAGDLFSSEDRYGTWKTVLTRSASRRDVFAGKVLAAGTFSVGLVTLAAASSIAAGLLLTGDQPLVGLSGTVLPSGESLLLVIVSWLLGMLPVLAFTSLAVLFSVATRNGIAGVLGPVLVGLVMQLLALVGKGAWVHMLLVSSAFDDWHGLLTAPSFYGPLIVGSCVSIVWVLACLGASWLIVARRDFAGIPVARRPGWAVPVRGVLGSAALIVLLGAAGNLGPVAVTKVRLEASITPAFNALTRLQQEQLGTNPPEGTNLQLHTSCRRRAGTSEGPGDDWSCTMSVLTPQAGANPFKLTPVTYDVGVKSNGCYKAQAPPSFVGRQMMSDEHGHTIVNPLFTIYGCFDITTAATPCPETSNCARSSPRPGASAAPPTRSSTTSTTPRARGGTATPRSGPASKGMDKAEKEALRKAERAAGPKVIQEINRSERQLEREAASPAEREPKSPVEPEAETQAEREANHGPG
jgi:ABC-2 type transport system permease protein